MPETNFSFGSDESEMLTTITLDKSFERVFASVAITVVIMLTLPWTVARAALLGLKCQIVPTHSKTTRVDKKTKEETSVTFALFCQLRIICNHCRGILNCHGGHTQCTFTAMGKGVGSLNVNVTIK